MHTSARAWFQQSPPTGRAPTSREANPPPRPPAFQDTRRGSAEGRSSIGQRYKPDLKFETMASTHVKSSRVQCKRRS